MTLINVPRKTKYESDTRFTVRVAKVKSNYAKIKKTYKEAGVKLPKQREDEQASKYVDRLVRQFRGRSEKKTIADKIEKWSATIIIEYSTQKADTIDNSDSSVKVNTTPDRNRSIKRYFVNFDHEPTEKELQAAYKQKVKEWHKQYDKLARQDYEITIYDYQGTIKREPLHLVQNNIRHIIMKTNPTLNCVVELLNRRYKTPINELTEFFQDNTSAEKINEWCKLKNIAHYAFDLANNAVYHTNNTDGSRRTRALIYYIADEHINEINDPKKRNSIIRKGSLTGAKLEELKKKNKPKALKKFPLEYIPITNGEDFKNDLELYKRLEKLTGSYYTTNNLWYIFFLITANSEDKRPPYTVSDEDTIHRLTYKNFTLHYCTKEQFDLCDSLGIRITTRRIGELVNKYMDLDMNTIRSRYNKQTYDVIRNASAAPLHHNFTSMTKDELNEQRKKNNLLNIDLKRCYPYVCMKYPTPYLTSDQFFEPFDGTPKPNYWYLVEQTTYNIVLGSSNFVPYHLLEYCDGIAITHQILPKYTDALRSKYVELSEDPKYKMLGNMFIGLLAKSTKRRAPIIYTSSLKEIGYYAFLTGSNVEYIDFNGRRLYKTVPEVNDAISQYRYRLAYLNIILTSRMLCMQMLIDVKAKLPNFIPIQINTDGVLGMQKKRVKLSWLDETSKTQPGDFRRKQVNEFIADIIKTDNTFKLASSENIKLSRLPKIKRLIYNKKWDAEKVASRMLELDGCLTNGEPGSGKTLLLTVLQELTPKESTITTTFTRLASTLIPNSKSLHDVFGVRTIENFDISDTILTYYKDKITHILVDECSMINETIYEALSLVKSINPKIKFYIFGDFDQYAPIKSNMILHKHPILRFLTDGNEIILNHQYRSNPDYIKNLKSENYSDLKEITNITHPTKFNIALTNDTCDTINQVCRYTWGDLNTPGCYVRFDKTTKIKGCGIIPKNLLCIMDKIDDKIYLTQIFNGKVELSLEYEMTYDQYRYLIDNGNIVLGYCISSYKSQGITIKEQYTIYDWNHYHMKKTARYVAASRTSDPKLCFYTNYIPEVDWSKILVLKPTYQLKPATPVVEYEDELIDVSDNIWDSI